MKWRNDVDWAKARLTKEGRWLRHRGHYVWCPEDVGQVQGVGILTTRADAIRLILAVLDRLTEE